ncbi:substrate-binding domain-containing protein [Bacillus sp. EB106-08-02-XG196]|jgi:phosphate transport system substrate-binding protein|uniref:PstS family phosphate ABC transporter substrate-binding protein n=1 Tax=Bacillus sp. EB106-08-02-XG196 TaxID=2737049 RepID=UPI0015C4865D|nr:substrate-binding domain-containing protein [Bacillus sp. EB106-08-02-XG196]NWQ42461.1 substrate-binding domain-containing protein [Bacillus sp. EB106-08-02-XG196]
MGKNLLPMFLYFGVVPLLISFITLTITTDNFLITTILPLIIGGLIAGWIASRNLIKSDDKKGLTLMFLLPLAYTAVAWAVFMLINGGFYGADSWLVYAILHIAMAPIFFMTMLMGEGRLFLWAPLTYEAAFVSGVFLSLLIKRVRPAFNKRQMMTVLTVFVLAIGTGAGVQWQRSKTVLPSYGFEYGGGYSSTDLTPYDVTNPANILPELESPTTFTIKNSSEMPILDGAEAAYPVYSAFANTVYENISNVDNVMDIVSFTNTIYSYERLLSGEVDIYFGAEPSKEQQEMAERQGKELVMTPIGKEAFVFFVNPDNKIDSLDVSEIQSIYSGKIKNWSELGGKNERIVAFQRPKNSGSQTLLEKIMGDTPIMEPLKEDVPEGMGGIIEQVADYRNYDNSIGFSFRFFATGMRDSKNIKLLAIDGVEPTPENISSGKYPFTANLYAITLKDNANTTIEPFLEWMKGPQGQEIIGKIGYIKN